MSALSTPGGGGTTAQSKPTSGKQKFQKLDINSLYCANRNESSEPSLAKSQLSRKHGMQSLGKVPSARRPPANLPSLRTETGQDPNSNSVSTVTTTVSTPATCTSQTITTVSNSGVVAGTGSAGWVPLPPPSSPHFRTEFPSLEAAAQPSHRSSDHSVPQPQLRPQTEGSWTCGGTAGVRPETTASPVAAPASSPASQQTPAYRAILPSFLMKGSSGTGLGLGTLSSLTRDNRNNAGSGSGNLNNNAPGPRQAPRVPATPRAVEVLTARPILREEEISSLDDISRDAGWAQHDDIDYDQKLDFSDGESSTPTTKVGNKNNNRNSIDNERMDSKIQDPDEEQLWAERRQKQSNEVAQAVARARQRKEEEQRRQMRDPRDSPASQPPKDNRDKAERNDRERSDNRERDFEVREKDRIDNRDKDRSENKDKDRNDYRERDVRDKDRLDNRERDRLDRFDNRDRDREREKERPIDNKDRPRSDNRDRSDSEKDSRDVRDRDRNDNRDRNDRDRSDRDRYDRERERNDRDGRERGDRAERERGDRDRDFRDRDRERDYVRDREQPTPFSKTFQQNIPPRFMKQQQNRQQDDQHKAWSFTGKPRRQEPPQYNAPRHNASHNNNRRSYSRDYSDREDDVRRDGPGPQWRSEMQDYDRPGRDLDRSNSKDSYKDFNEYKDRRNDPEKKSIDTSIEHSSRTAADKLTEVFERKSIGLTEPFASVDSSTQPQVSERRTTPPSHSVQSQRESFEKDFSKTSWAEVTQEEQSHSVAVKLPSEKDVSVKQIENQNNEPINKEKPDIITSQQNLSNVHVNLKVQNQSNNYHNNHTISNLPITHQQTNVTNLQNNIQAPISSSNQSQSSIFTDSHSIPKSILNQSPPKSVVSNELPSHSQIHKQPILDQTSLATVKPTIIVQKSEKELSESESIASKSSTDPSAISGNNQIDSHSVENIQDSQKRFLDDKKNERFNVEHINKIPVKEPVERKSSGSGSEKKGRGYGSGGYNVYGRGWGSRESRGRRSHRSSRSNNRASESDGSTDGANLECKERRKAPRSPRGLKKQDRPDDINQAAIEQGAQISDGLENREPFAPRGQPSRRGRGGFQGSNRPPAPAKRLAGYGLPNTKRPFSQANRAIKDHEDNKDGLQDDKDGKGNKSRTGSSSRKGRDRRTKGVAGPNSGEDENWETTSEHSESGGAGAHHRSGGGRHSAQSLKGQSSSRNQNCNNRQNNNRSQQAAKKEGERDKNTDITEATSDLKISTAKKDEEVVDDGFQEVRNKKNSKEIRGPTNVKDEKQPRSRSIQGGGRNGSSTRSSNDKSITRGSAPVSGKPTSQYDRPRQANLAPRFVKQRQKQQMGLISSFGPDISAAPPPPPVNAWDKPISQTLRGNVEEPPEVVDTKSSQSSQRSTPGDTSIEIKPVATPCALVSDKTGVLDGTTPPVETIIFENTNYKTTPPAEALKQKYQPSAATAKPQGEEVQTEMEARPLAFNGDMRDVRPRPRSIQELMAESGRPVSEAEGSLGLQMSFDASQKAEESDMKLDFAFDSDLGQLTEDKSAKTLGLPRGTHMSTSNTISAADLNFKIASVKKVWEMPAVVEGGEELQFAGLEETNTDTGAPPNVCKVKPTQQLQSPPPSHYNHVSYQGGYGGLSVPSPPAVLFNSTQPIINSSQQLQQQGGLYGAFLDQTRTQFGGFPGTPYGAGSATPYNYQPPPDMFQSLPSQYRMGPAGSGAAFGQSAQLGNSPSTVLISSTTNTHMSTVKPSTQQIGAIGSKGGGVGGVGVGGVGGVNTFQQQYLGYSGPEQYSLTGLLPRPAPPATSYYSPYQPPAAQAPTYPLQFTQPAVQQSSAFSSQFLSTQQLHAAAAAAVQQMQQQYRAPPLQTQYAPPQPRPPPQQQLKSPLHEHANGFAPLCDSASPTPKGASKPQKPPHSPPHKYHAPPPHQQHVQHPPPSHTPHQHHQQHQQHQHPQHQQHQQHQQQMVGGGNNGRGNGAGGNGSAMSRGGMVAPRYPAPIQRPHAPALPLFRAPPAPAPRAHHAPRPHLYYHHHQRNGGGGPERASEGVEAAGSAEEAGDSAPAPDAPAVAEVKAE